MTALSAAAREALAMLAESPRPVSAFNPGIVGRLVTGGLVRLIDLPSPYPTHRRRGRVKFVQHLQLTEVGEHALRDELPHD